ncbi:MAG TPA: hypothetical protein VGU68_16625 [Ktedonobacteraceae bacterium]|nr:hypothetical protein [Ktedonobacteraceae bacterium]
MESSARWLDLTIGAVSQCAIRARPSSKVTSKLQRFMRIADDLFSRLGTVGGKNGFGGTLA